MHSSNFSNIQNGEFRCGNIPEDYKCILCDFTSDLQIILKQHIRNCHEGLQEFRKSAFRVKNYICKQCGFGSYSLLVYFNHTKIRSQKCNSCDHYLKKPESESYNYVPSEDWEGYSCNQCFFKVRHQENFRKHILNFHTIPEWFNCDHCTYRTNTKSQLKEHLENTHNIVIYFCKLCEYKTTYGNNLQYHNSCRHSARQNEVNYKKCNQCWFKTIYIGSLRKHIFTQHTMLRKVRWHRCDKCKYKTNLRDDLLRHIKQKHVLMHTCDECPFNTVNKRLLEDHIIAQHTNPEKIEWFECNQCNYKSRIERNFKEHTRKHYQESQMLHKCSHCSYKSHCKSGLKIHISLIHGKRFECNKCDFKTKTKHNLKRHIAVIHGLQMKYNCNRCSFSAEGRRDLQDHMIAQHVDPDKLKAMLRDNFLKRLKLNHIGTGNIDS